MSPILALLLQGSSAASKRLRRDIERYGPVSNSVVITGETGSGKTLIAELLHQRSGRPGRMVRCAATSLSPSLTEDEVRGHDKGAYTGAGDARPGAAEEAHRGTLFLDEIHQATPSFRQLLLDICDGKPIRRLGGTRDLVLDVRILYATNVQPFELRKVYGFSEDLLHRMGHRHIRLAALHEQKEIIVPCAFIFLSEALIRLGKNFTPKLTHALQRLLVRHRLPGNLRQLKDLMETVAIHLDTDRPADVGDLPDLDLYERPCPPIAHPADLHALLEEVNGNKREASRRLGISPQTFNQRLKRAQGGG